jgi:hypothetical protein
MEGKAMKTLKEIENAVALITGSPAFAEIMKEYERLLKIISNVEDEEIPALCLVALANIGKPLSEANQFKGGAMSKKGFAYYANLLSGEINNRCTEGVNLGGAQDKEQVLATAIVNSAINVTKLVNDLHGARTYDELKRVIREAARIREESWDDVKFAAASTNRYSKTINEAVCEVTQDDDTIKLVSLLLAANWNGALEFAGHE